jgi:hypothetical protein
LGDIFFPKCKLPGDKNDALPPAPGGCSGRNDRERDGLRIKKEKRFVPSGVEVPATDGHFLACPLLSPDHRAKQRAESNLGGGHYGGAESERKAATMTIRNIDPIIRACTEDLPLEPSVGFGEKITRAIELMISHNISRIAVVRDTRAIGMIRLEDAFRELGLEIPVR